MGNRRSNLKKSLLIKRTVKIRTFAWVDNIIMFQIRKETSVTFKLVISAF